MIFQLPTSLLSELFINWLSLNAVAKLDSAVCSKKSRKAFLNTLNDTGCVLNEIVRDHAVNLLYWIVVRRVKLAGYSLPSIAISKEELSSFFATTGRYLKTLNIGPLNYTPRDILVPFVRASKGLQKLSIDQVSMDDLISILAECKSLQELTAEIIIPVSETMAGVVGDNHVDQLTSLVQGLFRLHIYNYGHESVFTDAQLLRIVESCPHLEVLWVGTNTEHTLQQVLTQTTSLIHSSSYLQHLQVISIHPSTLTHVLQHCRCLHTLKIKHCRHWDSQAVVDDAFTALSESSVLRIDINCRDMPWPASFDYLRNLKELKIRNDIYVTDFDIFTILRNSPHIETITMEDCPNVTSWNEIN